MEKMKRSAAFLVAVALLLSAFPALGEDGAQRQYVIDCFVNAVGMQNFPDEGADISAFADYALVLPQYRASMEIAVANGVVMGYEDNTLRPDLPVTRLEALLILGRCLPDMPQIRESAAFSDVPDWAAEEIDALYRAEIVNGYGNGLLGSGDEISAEQLELLVQRVSEAFSQEESVSLKDDFYSAVNSDFLNAGALLPGQLSVSRMSIMENINDERLINISENLLSRIDELENIGGAELQAARLYRMAYEGDLSQENDISALKYYFDLIDQCERLSELGSVNGIFLRDLGLPVLFDVSIPYRINSHGSLETIGGIYIGWLDTGVERSYWEDDEVYGAFCAYAREVLSLLGVADSEKRAEEIGEIQREIALAGMSRSEEVRSALSDNDDEQYVFSWDELSSRYTKEYTNLISRTLFAIDSEAMTGRMEYVISDVSQTDTAIIVLNEADLDTVKALCKLNLVWNLTAFMPSAYRNAYYRLFDFVMGESTPLTPQEYASSLTASVYTSLYEKIYLEKYADFEKEDVTDIVDEVIGAFRGKFQAATSVSPATISRAEDKLNKITAKVGEAAYEYDEDEDWFVVDTDKTLPGVGLDLYSRYGGTLYSVYYAADSDYPCYTVNASYNLFSNSISIYAGILASPLYSADFTPEENLGGVGFIIAHEIAHAFDETGSFYNSDGDYDPWWEEEDYEKFQAEAEKLARRYSGYEAVDGIYVDGEMTLDENIADILAMECIIQVAESNGLDLDKVFRAYASAWASVDDPAYAKYCALCDTHSPNRVRVNGVLSNFEEFYILYGIEEGDAMYVAPEDRSAFF